MLLSNSKNCPANFRPWKKSSLNFVPYKIYYSRAMIYAIATHRLLVDNKITDTNKQDHLLFIPTISKNNAHQ